MPVDNTYPCENPDCDERIHGDEPLVKVTTGVNLDRGSRVSSSYSADTSAFYHRECYDGPIPEDSEGDQ